MYGFLEDGHIMDVFFVKGFKLGLKFLSGELSYYDKWQ